jgi:hypothetical protein
MGPGQHGAHRWEGYMEGLGDRLGQAPATQLTTCDPKELRCLILGRDRWDTVGTAVGTGRL